MHGGVSLPNHVPHLEELERALLEVIPRAHQTAQSLTWAYTVEKLERKGGTNLR